jgi:phage-related protein
MANAALPGLMAKFDTFDTTVVPALLGFATTVGNVVDAVSGFFRTLGGAVDVSGTGRFAFLKEWIDTNLPLVQQLIETILSNIESFWEHNGRAIVTLVQNSFDTVFTVIDVVLKTVLDLVTLVLQLLNGDFEAAGVTLVNIVTRIWDGVTDIFGNALENVQALVLGIDWAWLGMQMIRGIANGVSGAAQFLASAATEAAQRAFDAAKGWLGIQSPSKRAADEIGKPFSEGIGVGITQQLGRVAQDVQIGLNGLIGEIPQPQFAAAAPGGGGGGYTITVNQTFNGPANEADVRRGAQAGILDAMRNLGLR